jgi:hypothetical protein
MSASLECQLALTTCRASSDALAFASTCARDQFDRPVLGHVNLCPSMLPEPSVMQVRSRGPVLWIPWSDAVNFVARCCGSLVQFAECRPVGNQPADEEGIDQA